MCFCYLIKMFYDNLMVSVSVPAMSRYRENVTTSMVFIFQVTEVYSKRRTDNADIQIKIKLTNELHPNSPECIKVYNIIFKRYSVLPQCQHLKICPDLFLKI